jgi:hypothetical protein
VVRKRASIGVAPNGILPEFVRILASSPLDGKAELFMEERRVGRNT